MKVIFTLITLLLFAAFVPAQSSTDITLGGVAVRYGTAENITVGPRSVWAMYPDVEFILCRRDMKLHITVIDDLGESQDQTLEALVSQMADNIYRAEVDENTWVQVNTSDGTTCVYQHCVARVFKPNCK